jgi:hypothetical protein
MKNNMDKFSKEYLFAQCNIQKHCVCINFINPMCIEDNIVHEDGKSNVHIAANKEELLQHATDAMISGTNLKDTAYGIHNSANPQNDDVIDADYEIINEEENSYGMGR